MDSLNELDRKNIWHPFTSLEAEEDPILIERGEGIYLHAHDGRKIIDAVSSWWVNLHGHGHPIIAKAVAMQAQKLEHVIFAGFTHEPAIHLSKNLLSILPQNQIKVFFSDNGSTAVEVALKMAFQFWHNQRISHKKKVVAMRGAYHGDTFGSMSVGERGLFTAPFSSYLFDVEYIDFPTSNNEEAVINQFKNLLNTEEVAAFIYEPLVQAAAGMRMYSWEILETLIGEAKGAEVVCIADEVFTGFGRTGKMFASNYLANEPDIVAVSKGITGGTMALGVTSCCEKIVSAFRSIDKEKTFFHGHSYTANPIACAAGNASFELLMDERCQRQIKMIEQLHLRFKQKFNGFKNVEEVRCLGTILALELKTHEKTSYFNEIRRKILPYFLSKNILLRPLGNVIYIVPPYVIQEHELTQIYSCIENFLLEIEL
ncbi:MAG TPA: adenosylmethionine--8-amino-7-oxononanoate transaminase [Chryseolinea sp.]|nr:adenosylmethionine--8-amino-7-oxononanoate transaminase [Chryseolinea sp.]